MLFELSKTFVAWAAIFPVSFFTGVFFRPLIRTNNLLLQGVLIYAVGLAILSNAIILLGAFHAINSAAVWGTLLFFGLLGLRNARYWIEWLKELREEFRIQNRSRTFRILVLFFFISSIVLLLGTLTPETGGDALCYQLNLPKVFLAQGSLTPDTYDYNSYFPLLMNNLYLIGLATGGVMAAKLFHFFSGLLLFLGMKAVVKRYTQNAALSLFIPLILWVTPTAYNQLASAYVDVGLALYIFLGTVLFFDALEENNGKTFLLSGFLLGSAVAVKYTALIAIAALGVVWVIDRIVRWREGIGAKGVVFCAIGFFAGCGYWLIRNGWETGNPFFPYFGSLFGLEQASYGDFSKYGTGRSFFDFLFLFWNMFYSPRLFGTFPARIGAFYFLLLPFVILAAIFHPQTRRYAIFCFSFLLVIFLIAPADRWLFPVLPFVAVTAAFGIAWLYSRPNGLIKTCRKALKF
ncbi:MAG: hypothetical protein HYZ83_03875 [Candidatus Omnitrophica bacterium]|nr:hypothetical protein [Candidatus Omnitrophota bacterium]